MFKSKRTKQLEARVSWLEDKLAQKLKQCDSLEEKLDNLEQEAFEASAEKERKEIEKYFKEGETVTYLGRGYVIIKIAKETDNYGRRLTGKAVMQTQYRHSDGRLLKQTFYIDLLPALITGNKKTEKEKEKP